MGMQNKRLPFGIKLARGQMRGNPAQQRKTLDVVGPLLAFRVVVRVAGTLVKVRRVNHVNADAVVGHAAQAQGHTPSAKNRPQLTHRGQLLHTLQNCRQAGQDDAYIRACFDQCLRQGSQHIRQPPRLDQGKNFSSCQQNFHGPMVTSPGGHFFCMRE